MGAGAGVGVVEAEMMHGAWVLLHDLPLLCTPPEQHLAGPPVPKVSQPGPPHFPLQAVLGQQEVPAASLVPKRHVGSPPAGETREQGASCTEHEGSCDTTLPQHLLAPPGM